MIDVDQFAIIFGGIFSSSHFLINYNTISMPTLIGIQHLDFSVLNFMFNILTCSRILVNDLITNASGMTNKKIYSNFIISMNVQNPMIVCDPNFIYMRNSEIFQVCFCFVVFGFWTCNKN